MKAFHELEACDITRCALQEEISTKGYVLIRGLLPQEAVNSVLGDVIQVLSAAGWLLPDHEPQERKANISAACGDPDRPLSGYIKKSSIWSRFTLCRINRPCMR